MSATLKTIIQDLNKRLEDELYTAKYLAKRMRETEELIIALKTQIADLKSL